MNKKVLIIDDEKHMLELLKKVLEQEEDISVAVIEDPEQALKYVESHEVDLIVTDVSMPKMQGTDLFFQLKKMNPFLQVIIMTAYPTLENIIKMLEGGASDFIVKPFDIEHFQKVVADTFARIDRWKSLRMEWLKYKRMSSGW